MEFLVRACPPLARDIAPCCAAAFLCRPTDQHTKRRAHRACPPVYPYRVSAPDQDGVRHPRRRVQSARASSYYPPHHHLTLTQLAPKAQAESPPLSPITLTAGSAARRSNWRPNATTGEWPGFCSPPAPTQGAPRRAPSTASRAPTTSRPRDCPTSAEPRAKRPCRAGPTMQRDGAACSAVPLLCSPARTTLTVTRQSPPRLTPPPRRCSPGSSRAARGLSRTRAQPACATSSAGPRTRQRRRPTPLPVGFQAGTLRFGPRRPPARRPSARPSRTHTRMYTHSQSPSLRQREKRHCLGLGGGGGISSRGRQRPRHVNGRR